MSAVVIARRTFTILVFFCALVLAIQLIGELNRVKALETDLAEINNVRYGLLDAEEWVDRVSDVLERRITEFELTETNRPEIKHAIERALDAILVQIDGYLRESARPRGESLLEDLGRLLRRGVQTVVLDLNELRAQVPDFAEMIVQELSRPEARRALKDQIMAFLDQAASSTFSRTDRSRLYALMARYGCGDAPSCTGQIEAQLAQKQRPLLYRQLGLYGLVALLFAICLLAREPTDARHPTARGFDVFRLTMLTGATLILLAGGILTPMIEIEARISELSLEIMGEPIAFTNQVLYFQSKSIFDVVSILARTGAGDMILVAFLIVTFSVVFPAFKLLATYLYFYDVRGSRSSDVIHFFAFRSAKWSMADVLVIAIFMAYIGFSGLVGSQLSALRGATRSVEILTTNGTVLAPGFFLFLGFVLASLLLSTVLEARTDEKHPS